MQARSNVAVKPLKASAQRVQDAIIAAGYGCRVIELDASTRTAAEAAAAVGCTVGQIAKSLVFVGRESGRAYLVIASGAHRVDEQRVAQHSGERLEKADADAVRAATGYVIGGVPPLGHDRPLTTLIDQELLQYATIWAAAGNPNALFELTPGDLVGMTGGAVIAIA
jgi:Cys-tRNA(Pro) deacylase